jgi:hypothetical protein
VLSQMILAADIRARAVIVEVGAPHG